MKRFAQCLAIVPLLACLAACGSATREPDATRASAHAATTAAAQTSTVKHAMSPRGYLIFDGDTDSDDEPHQGVRPDDDDDRALLNAYGGLAGQAETQAVAAVVKRYYAAAAAGDGMEVCALLYSSLAAGLGEDSSKAGAPETAGCAASANGLLAQEHDRLSADDVATMTVISVHAKGGLALALVGFRTQPEGEILLRREGHAWKLDALLDSEVP